MNLEASPMPTTPPATNLSYSLTTHPSPPTVSRPGQQPERLTLTIVASNSGDKIVVCDEISIFFPVGLDGKDLTSTGDGIEVSAEPSNRWVLAFNEPGHYTFAGPNGVDPSVTAAEGFTFVIENIPMSTVVGSVDVQIGEKSGLPDPHKPDAKVEMVWTSTTLTVPKFPAGFTPVKFEVTPPYVQADQQVTATWHPDRVGTYEMIVNDERPIPVTGKSSWQSPKLTGDTTFTLRVTCESAGISKEFSKYVSVGRPTVQHFSSEPDPIDYGDEVTLHWETSDADHTVLRADPQGLPQSFTGDQTSAPLRPVLGMTYWLVPYKGGVEGQAVQLSHSFNPPDLELTAKPSSLLRPLHVGTPTVMATPPQDLALTYLAKNVQSFTIDSTTTSLLDPNPPTIHDSKTYRTASPACYSVSAVDLAGRSLRKEVQVGVRQFNVSFLEAAGKTTVTFTLQEGEETEVAISNAQLCFSTSSDFLAPQGGHRSQPQAVELVKQGTVWIGQLEFDPPDRSSYITAGILFDCKVAGPTGPIFSAAQDMTAWREFGGTGTDVVLPADAWTQHPVKARAIAVTQGSSDPWVAFYVDMANAVYWKSASDSGWTHIPNIAATEVTAQTNPDGRVEVYVIDVNRKIKHNTQSQPNGDFQDDWENVGPGEYVSISAGFDYSGESMVAAIDSLGVLNLVWVGSGSQGVGSSRLARVSMAASVPDFFQILVSNVDLTVYQARNGVPGPPNPWETVSGGYTQARDVAVVKAADGYSTQYHCGNRPSLYVRREGGQWRRFFNGDVPVQATRLAVATDRNGADVVFIVGPDNALSHTSQSMPGTW